MESSFRIARIRGIDVGVHYTWLLAFALVSWSLASGYFPQNYPGWGRTLYWTVGVAAALMLFISVLLHELSHSFVAQARGLQVHSITLFIFGGVSNLAGEAKQPGAEFQIAVVGPLTSFVLGALAFLVASASTSPPVEAIASYLAVVNVALGAFNLVPGFPLDGGRVLRSIVWSATNDLRRATEIATGVGQVVAWGLMLWGFWRVLDGDVFGGIWMAAIGWFLQNAAVASLQQTVLETRIRRLRVRDVIRPDPSGVPPDTSVADLIERFVLPGARRAVPVVDDGAAVGIVTLSDIHPVPAERRRDTSVDRIMTPRERLVTVSSNTPLSAAIEALGRGDYEQVPVVDEGRLVGLLSRADVLREIQIREALDLPESVEARGRA